MKVSDYVVDLLVQNQIDIAFSYIGKNAHLCDSIDKRTDIRNVFTIHEQGAGFSAEGYARATGKTGLVTVTSGPGATNLVTSIADCYADSTPAIFIVGEVEIADSKGDRNIRQFGFQETDIVSIVKPVTKYSTLINSLQELRYEFEKALFLAQEGRKGPVLVGLPENFQYQKNYEPEQEKSFFGSDEHLRYSVNRNVSHEDVSRVAQLINESKRPVILLGGGVRLANASSRVAELLNKTKIPMVYSLMGKDAMSAEYQYNLGFIGNFGNRYSNLTLANADFLLVLGSRLDNLQTGRNVKTFAREAKVVQVDIDTNELGIRIGIDVPINACVGEFLDQLNKFELNPTIDDWHRTIVAYKKKFPAEFTLDNKDKIGNQIIAKIAEHADRDDIICVDVGEHQMLTAQSFRLKTGQRLFFSGGFGAMGCALPVAIGATLATGNRSIVIAGDGGFQMNIQELEIVKRRNLPIKMFIINNNSLYMVKLRQDTYLEGNCVGSVKDYSVPNFKRIGEAYGIKSHEIHGSGAGQLIEQMLGTDDCEIVDIHLEGAMTTVEPRLDFNRSFEDMRPYLDKEELKGHMVIKTLDE